MANIFGILTAVVLAFAAFIAYKNKQAYGYELEHRKTEEVKLKASEVRLEKAKTELAATQKQRSETETEVAKLKTDEAARKAANTALTQQIDTQKVTVEANKKQLDGIREKTAPFGEIASLTAKVKDLRTATVDLKESIATNEGKLANLSNENSRMEGQIQVFKGENEMVARRESYFIKTRINSLYPSWGFVTLGAGTTSGVVSGSTLEVVRGTTPVAKLLVTAVESNTASASIVPDSLAQGTALMVGDQVVAAHKTAEAAPKKPAPLPKVPEPAADAEPAAEPAADAMPAPEADPFAEPAAEPAAEPEAEKEL